MPKFPYLLVQKLASGIYEIFDICCIQASEDANVQVLIDDAGQVVYATEGLSQKMFTFKVYTLMCPLSNFLGQPFPAIREQLGPLDAVYFQDKAATWPSVVSLASLKATDCDGKIVVVFGMSRKRMRSVTEPRFDHMKRSKLATIAPSTMAKPSNYEKNQDTPSEKILDDRPQPDADIAPIALLYAGFGEFLDIFRGEPGGASLAKGISLKLNEEVDGFAEKMCRFYHDDAARRNAALRSLNRIFSARTGTAIPELKVVSIDPIKSDSLGHNVAMHGGALLVSEFRNCAAGNDCIAEVELTAHVARLNATGMEEYPDLFERWRVPSLGLTVVGPDVRFYAIIVIDRQYRLVNLTPSLSCIRSASDGDDRKALYRAFAAASVLQARILDDGQKFLKVPPPEILPGAHRFPSVTRLRKKDPSTEYLSFQILGYHLDRQSYRLLYLAETTGPEEKLIIVKFVKRYSIQLHAFCAERGFAPAILAFEQLPGGWNAIAMEYIASSTMITHSSALDTHRDKWTAELLQFVKDFHAEGLVHGDLRDANIICHDHSVMLLDFDWGGQDGEVSYPTPYLNSELLEGRSSDDLRITKEDDDRVLKKTLGKLTK